MAKTVLYGASGHGKVIADIFVANGVTDIMFWDDSDNASTIGDYMVTKPQLDGTGDVSLVISIGDNKTRMAIANKCREHVQFVTAIHPSVIAAKSVIIAEGTVVMPGAILNADARVGEHCIINTAAVIEHDCVVEDYCHISPNATLCGNVWVGEGSHIGAGAVVIPGVKIGKWCRVGAGSVVIKDVPNNTTVAGCPAKKL